MDRPSSQSTLPPESSGSGGGGGGDTSASATAAAGGGGTGSTLASNKDSIPAHPSKGMYPTNRLKQLQQRGKTGSSGNNNATGRSPNDAEEASASAGTDGPTVSSLSSLPSSGARNNSLPLPAAPASLGKGKPGVGSPTSQPRHHNPPTSLPLGPQGVSPGGGYGGGGMGGGYYPVHHPPPSQRQQASMYPMDTGVHGHGSLHPLHPHSRQQVGGAMDAQGQMAAAAAYYQFCYQQQPYQGHCPQPAAAASTAGGGAEGMNAVPNHNPAGGSSSSGNAGAAGPSSASAPDAGFHGRQNSIASNGGTGVAGSTRQPRPQQGGGGGGGAYPPPPPPPPNSVYPPHMYPGFPYPYPQSMPQPPPPPPQHQLDRRVPAHSSQQHQPHPQQELYYHSSYMTSLSPQQQQLQQQQQQQQRQTVQTQTPSSAAEPLLGALETCEYGSNDGTGAGGGYYYSYCDPNGDPNGDWSDHVVDDDGSGYHTPQQQQQQHHQPPYQPQQRPRFPPSQQHPQPQPQQGSSNYNTGHSRYANHVDTVYGEAQGYPYSGSDEHAERQTGRPCETANVEADSGSPEGEAGPRQGTAKPSTKAAKQSKPSAKQTKSLPKKETAKPSSIKEGEEANSEDAEREGGGESHVESLEAPVISEHLNQSGGELHSVVETESFSSLEHTQSLESNGNTHHHHHSNSNNSPDRSCPQQLSSLRQPCRSPSSFLRSSAPVGGRLTTSFSSLINGAVVGNVRHLSDSPLLPVSNTATTATTEGAEGGKPSSSRASAGGDDGGAAEEEQHHNGDLETSRRSAEGEQSGTPAARRRSTTAIPIDAELEEDEQEKEKNGEEHPAPQERPGNLSAGPRASATGAPPPPPTDAAPPLRGTHLPPPPSSRPFFHHHQHHHQSLHANRTSAFFGLTTPITEAAQSYCLSGSLSSSPVTSVPPAVAAGAASLDAALDSPYSRPQRGFPSTGSTSSLRQFQQQQQQQQQQQRQSPPSHAGGLPFPQSAERPQSPQRPSHEGVGAAATMATHSSSPRAATAPSHTGYSPNHRGGTGRAAITPGEPSGSHNALSSALSNASRSHSASGQQKHGPPRGDGGGGVGSASQTSERGGGGEPPQSVVHHHSNGGGGDFSANSPPPAAGPLPSPSASPSLTARGGGGGAAKRSATPTAGSAAASPQSVQTQTQTQAQAQAQHRPRNHSRNNSKSSNVNSNSSNTQAPPLSPFLYEYHTGTEVWVQEAEPDFPFDPSAYGNFACLVDALSPDVPVAYEMQLPCDESSCPPAPPPHAAVAAAKSSKAAATVVSEKSEKDESRERDTAVAAYHDEFRLLPSGGDNVHESGAADAAERRKSDERMNPLEEQERCTSSASCSHASSSGGAPACPAVRPYCDFSGPYFTEPIVTLESVWQSFDAPFGCSVSLAHPAFLSKMRPPEDGVVYVPILSGFRVRFHGCSAAHGKLQALRLLRGQYSDANGEEPTDGLLTWSASERPDNRNGVAEQIRKLAQADEAYTTLLTATTADVDHQSWVAVMWQPVFCGGHSAKQSCGTFLAYYLLRAPHHLFLPYAEKSHGAAMNSSWNSPVFRADRVVVAFDLWSFNRRYELGRKVEGAWKQQQQQQQQQQRMTADNGVGCARVPAVVGDGCVDGDDHSQQLYASPSSTGHAGTSSHVTDAGALELRSSLAMPPIPPPYVRLPIVGFIPNRCRSDVWLLPSNLPLSGSTSAAAGMDGAGGNGGVNGKGGAVWPFRAPLFLLVSALQLMVWNATEESSRIDALKRLRQEEEEKAAVAALASSTEEPVPKARLPLEDGAADESEGLSKREGTLSMLSRAMASTLASNRAFKESSHCPMVEESRRTTTSSITAPPLAADILCEATEADEAEVGEGKKTSKGESSSSPSEGAASPERSSTTAGAAAAAASAQDGTTAEVGYYSDRDKGKPYFKKGVELMTRAAQRYRQLRDGAMLDYSEDTAARASPSVSPSAANCALLNATGGRRGVAGSGAMDDEAFSSSQQASCSPSSSPAATRCLIVGGTSRERCGLAGDVIVGLLDFYQWAQYDTALMGFAEHYCMN